MIFGEMSDQRLSEIRWELEGILYGVTLGTFDWELIAGLEVEKRKSKLLEEEVLLLRTPAAIGLDRAEMLAAISLLTRALESLRPMSAALKSASDQERLEDDSRLAYLNAKDAARGIAIIDSAVQAVERVRESWPHLSDD